MALQFWTFYIFCYDILPANPENNDDGYFIRKKKVYKRANKVNFFCIGTEMSDEPPILQRKVLQLV